MPYAIWAKRYDWAFIQPNYRGAFDNPEAMASDMAVQDIIDAVNFAKGDANIDASRIYLVGSSGGAMTALVAASRRPDIWAGVAAWVPVFDLVDWYKFTTQYPERYYLGNVECACGGRVYGGEGDGGVGYGTPRGIMNSAGDGAVHSGLGCGAEWRKQAAGQAKSGYESAKWLYCSTVHPDVPREVEREYLCDGLLESPELGIERRGKKKGRQPKLPPFEVDEAA